jgi:putative ABC transport system permease protein
MIGNYFKVARRSLIRDKLYSLISVVGLAVGIACCLLIFLYVQDELSFDRFHRKAHDIYRLIRVEQRSGEETVRSPSVTYNIAPELKANFKEVQRIVRLTGGDYIVSRDGQSFTQNALHVDPGFLDMFSFPLIRGDSRSALDDPVSAVITPETARKYFGEEDPLGKTLTINLGETSLDFTVTGIVQDPPRNSSIRFDLLLPVDPLKYNFPEDLLHSWDIVVMQTFVELAPGRDASALEQKFPALTSRLFAEEERGFQRSYQLQALTDIHLNSDLEGVTGPTSNPLYSHILAAIAFAVLLLACINFTTLAVGRSSSRAREVGLRKVLGAGRAQLMRQFWGEALLLSLAALVLGMVLAELFLPTFNGLSQKQLSLGLFSDWILLPTLAGLALFTAFLAGMYPSLLLSRLYPVDSLRGNVRLGGRSRLIQGLVVVQFAISVALVVSTLAISSQMRYVNGHNLGYDRNMVLTFPTGTYGETAAGLLSRFRHELSGQPAVVSVTGYSYGFGDSWLRVSQSDEGMNINIGEDITSPGPSEGPGSATNYFYVNWVDPYYLPTMGITVNQGRNFSTDIPSDAEGAILVNQTAVKAFGWDDPIGQQLPAGFQQARVVGVVEDFYFYPLHRRIEPLVLHMPRHDHLSSIYEIAVRIQSRDLPATLSLLQQTWQRVSGGMPFDYQFLDDRVARQYAAEQRWMRIVRYSTVFSLVIACLGLFGLTSLAVARRTKEVGIRKVLGASVSRIVTIFAGDFAKLVLVANLIAWPVAYVIMHRWLQNFAYHADLTAAIFIWAGGLSLGIALLTVGLQAMKAALADPVETLRYE